MSISTLTPKTNRDEWTQAGSKAADAAASAGEMAGHAASAVGAMAQQAVCDVGQKADDLTAQAGSGIDHLGSLFGEHTPQDGVLGSASQAVAQTVQRGGKYLEEAKLSGTAATLTELIRQHPVAAVVAGIAAGYLVARALRN
jgi:hypothetical protein